MTTMRSVFLLSSILALSYSASCIAAVDESLQIANSAFVTGDYKKAIALYSDAFKRDPQSASIGLMLSDSYFEEAFLRPEEERESGFNQSKEILIPFTLSQPKNSAIWAHLAKVSGQIALFRSTKEKIKLGGEIKADVDKALELDSQNILANGILGVWHYELARLSFFERAFASLLYSAIPEGDFGKAVIYLKKAVELDPHHLFFRLAYGKALHETGARPEAYSQWRTVLKLQSSFISDNQVKEKAKQLLEADDQD